MKKINLNETAINLWWEKIELGCRQDFEVNDLLERISNETRAAYDPSDIWISICNLTNSAKRRFIREARAIM